MQAWLFTLALMATPQADAAVVTQFEGACQAFDQGHWEAAEAGFQKLCAMGLSSGWLMYDLGNSHLRAGRLGEAIASYREALVDLPRHSDIKANLEFARRRVQDAVAPIEPAPLPRSLFVWHYVLNFREALWVLGTALALFWITRIGVLLTWQPRVCARLSVFFALVGVAVGASLAVHTVYPTCLGVIIADEVDVRTSNQTQAPVRFRLHAGCETQVHAQLDGWVLVALSDGKQGWVPRQSVALVAL